MKASSTNTAKRKKEAEKLAEGFMRWLAPHSKAAAKALKK